MVNEWWNPPEQGQSLISYSEGPEVQRTCNNICATHIHAVAVNCCCNCVRKICWIPLSRVATLNTYSTRDACTSGFKVIEMEEYSSSKALLFNSDSLSTTDDSVQLLVICRLNSATALSNENWQEKNEQKHPNKWRSWSAVNRPRVQQKPRVLTYVPPKIRSSGVDLPSGLGDRSEVWRAEDRGPKGRKRA